MTVSTTTTYNEATGAGGVKTFYFTFRCDDSSWVKVYLDDVLQAAGYTVALNADQSTSPGGSVTFSSAPDGYDIRIHRETARTQETNYTAYDSFPADTHELALDKAVLLVQDEARNRVDGDAATLAAIPDIVVAEASGLIATAVAAEAALRAAADAAEAYGRAAADAAIIASGDEPADVGLAPVIATGTVQASTVNDRAAREFWIEDFGEAGTGDWTAIFNAALTFLVGAAGSGPGGTLKFGRRTYLVSGKVLFPTSGAGGGYRQPDVRLVGQGSYANGQNSPSAPASGTVLDMRYAGDAVARIDTRGFGKLEIEGITLADLQATPSSTPFIQTTNTTLLVHGCGFFTNDYQTNCRVDAIVLGGTDSGSSDDGPNSPFQGYGTVIENNFANGIRRMAYLRIYCNGTVVRNNTMMHRCGTNDMTNAPAPFDVLGHVTNTSCGNVIIGNLIEMPAYKYGVRLGAYASGNTVAHNNLYDQTATALAAVYCGVDATQNLIISGHGASYSGDVYLIEDASATGKNTLINSHQDRRTVLPGGLNVGAVDLNLGNTIKMHPGSALTATVEMEGAGSGTAPGWLLYLTRAGGARTYVAQVQHSSAGNAGEYIDFSLYGAIRSQILSSALLRIQAPNGSRVEIGNPSTPQAFIALDNAIAFRGETPQARASVSGSRGGNAALASLLTALHNLGLITDSTTA